MENKTTDPFVWIVRTESSSVAVAFFLDFSLCGFSESTESLPGISMTSGVGASDLSEMIFNFDTFFFSAEITFFSFGAL